MYIDILFYININYVKHKHFTYIVFSKCVVMTCVSVNCSHGIPCGQVPGRRP